MEIEKSADLISLPQFRVDARAGAAGNFHRYIQQLK